MQEESQTRPWIIRASFIILSIIAIVLALIQFAATAYSDDECDSELRLWLVGSGTVLVIAAVPVLFIESCFWTYLKTQGMFYYKAVYIVIGCFLAFWTAIGLFLLSGDSKCADDFENGYEAFMGTTGAYLLILTIYVAFFSLAYAFDWLETEKTPYQPV